MDVDLWSSSSFGLTVDRNDRFVLFTIHIHIPHPSLIRSELFNSAFSLSFKLLSFICSFNSQHYRCNYNSFKRMFQNLLKCSSSHKIANILQRQFSIKISQQQKRWSITKLNVNNQQIFSKHWQQHLTSKLDTGLTVASQPVYGQFCTLGGFFLYL